MHKIYENLAKEYLKQYGLLYDGYYDKHEDKRPVPNQLAKGVDVLSFGEYILQNDRLLLHGLYKTLQDVCVSDREITAIVYALRVLGLFDRDFIENAIENMKGGRWEWM